MIPRVVLAIDRSSLQRSLRARLAQGDVIIDVLKGKSRLWSRLKREVCDLVVISHSRVPEPAAGTIGLLTEVPDAPAIVVLLREGDPELRAQLLAAGCQAVLDEAASVEGLVDVLQALLVHRRELAQQQLAAKGMFAQPRLMDFVSRSPVMQTFLEVIQRVVQSNVPLLILGETGVGKERLARAIHNDGGRSSGPFVAINCGALPETLLESELFGHEEGAFTGATRSRRGCFELAHGGTVFLDEIGDLPNHLQVKLLRVLQDHEVRRLGGERSFTVDVRVMAATNRDLEEEIEAKRFRRDLYYRLGVMTLTLPPLRERQEDIPELISNYIEYLGQRIGSDVTGIDDDAIEAMVRYSWPGNVRELINVVERAMLLCASDTITLVDLPVNICGSGDPTLATMTLLTAAEGHAGLPRNLLDRPWRDVRREVLDRVERAYLSGLLRRTRGRVGRTAELAGIEPRSLYEKMRRLGLSKEDFKES